MKLERVTLEGRVVRLEPLTLAHVPALCEIGLDESLWRLTIAQIATEADMRAYVQEALDAQSAGKALPFATVDAATGRVIGSTRFGNADLPNRRVEIGWTWIAPAWQRTGANTEAKVLMLRHAFEGLGCMRVELKTDVLNTKSRNAMLRIGATEEGVHRKHQVTQSGRIRDSVWFSIVDDEWPRVRERLLEMMSRPYPPSAPAASASPDDASADARHPSESTSALRG
jgi:RimJ/RimL family protein N-acetyltransferase